MQACLAKHHIAHICLPLHSPDLAPCDFWLFPNLKSPLKLKRFVIATVTQYTSSVSGVSLPTDYPHERVTLHGCAVRSSLTGCQVTLRPHYRFSRYSKWIVTFRTLGTKVQFLKKNKMGVKSKHHGGGKRSFEQPLYMQSCTSPGMSYYVIIFHSFI